MSSRVAKEHYTNEGAGGAFSWEEAELMAPECSPRWDADGMGEWQGEREGPYLHLSWLRKPALIAVVQDQQGKFACARWDGPLLGWKRDATVGTLSEVMRTRPLIEEGTVEPSVMAARLAMEFEDEFRIALDIFRDTNGS